MAEDPNKILRKESMLSVTHEDISANPDIKAFEQEVRDEGSFTGRDGPPVSLQRLVEFWEVVDTAPTHEPRTPFEQIKLYVNGATYRIYFYDYKAGAWRYVA